MIHSGTGLRQNKVLPVTQYWAPFPPVTIKCPDWLHFHKPGGSLLIGSGYGNRNLRPGRASAPFSTFSFSAEIGFIHLHKSLKLVLVILLFHSSPDFMQHGPGDPIADSHFLGEGKSRVVALVT